MKCIDARLGTAGRTGTITAKKVIPWRAYSCVKDLKNAETKSTGTSTSTVTAGFFQTVYRIGTGTAEIDENM